MKPQQPSYTAKGVAVHRALESEKAPEQRICYDPFARRFVGKNFTACGEVPLPQWLALWLFQMWFPGFHEYFLARTRHFDECLLSELKHGLQQVVILGAGYDSRPYRIDRLGRDIAVFEVDHPATQQDKLARLKEFFTPLLERLVYIPMNFNTQCLLHRLFESGYNADLKTLFLWEGVTYYLSAHAVDEVLNFIYRHTGQGSSIIFDYTYPEVIEGKCARIEAINWRLAVRASEEALTFGIDKAQIDAFLSQRGFCRIHNADGKWLEQKYFTGIHRERKVTPIFSVVHAKVKKYFYSSFISQYNQSEKENTANLL